MTMVRRVFARHRLGGSMHKRFALGLLATVAVLGSVGVQAANTIQDFLSAPKWYVQYDMTFKVAHTGTGTNNGATTKTHITMNRTFSATCVLDMRMDGPSTVLNSSVLSGSADGSTPTVAEQMKHAQELMARMETTANWMSGGGLLSIDENASDADQQAALAAAMQARYGPATMEYVRIDSTWGLVNETGTGLNRSIRTTWTGNGMVFPGGGVDPLLEVDAPSGTYTLTLPYSFNAMEAMIKSQVTTIFTDPNWTNPDVHRDSSETGMGNFPSDIAADDPKNIQAAMILIRGSVNPASGKISGEHSVAAHYTEATTPVPGTLTMHYTLSLTPPVKK
jgi:hypothetical protein